MTNPITDWAVKKGLQMAGKWQEKAKTQGREGQNPYAEGSRYYDLWNSNPWTPEKMTQQQTVWDKVANAFGFRSAYDTAVDQRAQAAAEYDAQIVQLQGEDKYNDPAAQAARLQNAGINPAIAGGVEGSQAGEFAQEATSPEITPDENLTRIGGLMNGIAQAITLASGLVDTSVGTAINLEQLEGARIQNYTGLERLADEWFKNWTPDKEFDIKNKPEHLTDMQYMESIIMNAANAWAKNMGMSKNKQRDFHNAIQHRVWGSKSVMFDKWTKNEQSRTEWAKHAGSMYYTGSKDSFEDIIECIQPITELWDQYVGWSSRDKANRAQNSAEESAVISGTTSGEAQNAQNSAAKQREKLEEDMNQAKAKVMRNLAEEAKKGNKWAFFLSLVLPVLFNRIEGAQVSKQNNTNAKGETTSSSNWAF